MTSRELRNQRREQERKARKLAYQQSRAAAASASETCGAGSLAGGPVARPAFVQSERRGPTGPTTPESKATSSGNSLKHGLASGRVIIPGEDPAEFEALVSDLVREHAPANETESLLVQQMAQSWWLMQRAIRIQNQAFTETRVDTHKLALFLRYQTTHERAFYKALNTLLAQNRGRQRAQAVSCRRRSSPEFVSQKPVGTMHASPISQKTAPDLEFVSQIATEPFTKSSSFRKTVQELTADRLPLIANR